MRHGLRLDSAIAWMINWLVLILIGVYTRKYSEFWVSCYVLWSVGIPTVLGRLLTVSFHTRALKACNLPAVKAVQWDCERVSADEGRDEVSEYEQGIPKGHIGEI